MITPEKLVDNMNRIGIHYLVDEGSSEPPDRLTPAELMAGLAVQSDARLRSALIAVLLQRPDFSRDVNQALALLNKQEESILKLYYTAACLLQRIYANQLQDLLGHHDLLPDFFSEEWNIERSISARDQLKELADLHKNITGLSLNWYGTYESAATRVITRLEKERSWAAV